MAHLKIGSRGSQLALWQANHVAGLLRGRGHRVDLEVIKTTGDTISEIVLSKVGTKGMFTKEIEEALMEGKVDLAVHSLKDVPTELPAGFELKAIMEREDARDVFISARFSSLSGLPRGASVGTSSLRRTCQLKAAHRHLNVVPLRGNVDTRLKKLSRGDCDAIILAAAGVKRLQQMEMVKEFIDPNIICPAAGQGALAIEVREDDKVTTGCVAFLDHPVSRSQVSCERELLRTLGGGCQVPIGAFAESNGSTFNLTAVVAKPDGSEIFREQQRGTDPIGLGRRVGESLLERGADRILREVYSTRAPGLE